MELDNFGYKTYVSIFDIYKKEKHVNYNDIIDDIIRKTIYSIVQPPLFY